MTTPLHLSPILTGICLTAFAVLWLWLGLRAWKRTRPNELARQRALLEAAAASGTFSKRGKDAA